MQIHEITESKIAEAGAFGSFLSGLTGGLTDKYKSSVAPNGASLNKKIAKVWLDYAQRLKDATPDPVRYDTLYQQTLTAFVQKNLLGGQPINSAINKQEINQMISAISAAKDNPEQVATLMPKLIQQTSLSQQDVAGGSQQLAKVVSLNPDVIEYRGITYTVNDSGYWANQRTGKVPDQSFQAFLDQEINKAGGSAPTPTSPPPGEIAPAPRRVSRSRGGR